MHDATGICTGAIILLTLVMSYLGFRDPAFEAKYLFHPESILARKQFYRLVTSSLLHANWTHLGLNMVTLYLFGPAVEAWLGWEHFLLVYLAAVVGGDLLSLYVHRHHEYQAYGASGGVCGIIFSYLLLFPGAEMSFFFLPVTLPAWLYALLFIGGSFYGMKHNLGNIGHDAHLGGAIVAFLVTALLQPSTVHYNLRLFLVVLIPSVLVLTYLWFNPLFLPLISFIGHKCRWRSKTVEPPPHPRRQGELDAVLDKIAAGGLGSLTEEEKALLDETSAKYQRRTDSHKPESGLAI